MKLILCTVQCLIKRYVIDLLSFLPLLVQKPRYNFQALKKNTALGGLFYSAALLYHSLEPTCCCWHLAGTVIYHRPLPVHEKRQESSCRRRANFDTLPTHPTNLTHSFALDTTHIINGKWIIRILLSYYIRSLLSPCYAVRLILLCFYVWPQLISPTGRD